MTMIETKDLTFAYPAEEGKRSEPALRGVSLGIEKGSFVDDGRSLQEADSGI